MIFILGIFSSTFFLNGKILNDGLFNCYFLIVIGRNLGKVQNKEKVHKKKGMMAKFWTFSLLFMNCKKSKSKKKYKIKKKYTRRKV